MFRIETPFFTSKPSDTFNYSPEFFIIFVDVDEVQECSQIFAVLGPRTRFLDNETLSNDHFRLE